MTPTTTATTEHAPHKGAGFPPFKTETFPSQLFWLAITFVFLFVVLWRVAGPRIAGTITARRGQISDDLAAANKNKSDADAANAAYLTALAGARARAQSMADTNRKSVAGEIDAKKSSAEAEAHALLTKVEAEIEASRAAARSQIVLAAQDAVIQIVARLTGETVSADEASAAVRAAAGS